MSDKKEQTFPTWGYHASEPDQIFELKKGEKLPAGWKDTPAAFEKIDEEKPRARRAKAED